MIWNVGKYFTHPPLFLLVCKALSCPSVDFICLFLLLFFLVSLCDCLFVVYICLCASFYICCVCLFVWLLVVFCTLFRKELPSANVMELWGGSEHEFWRRKISFWFAKLLPVDWSKARKCSLVIGFGETFLARFCRSLTLSWLWLPKYVQTLMSFTFILPELVLKITVKHKAAELEGILHIWQRLPVLNIPGGVLTWNLF